MNPKFFNSILVVAISILTALLVLNDQYGFLALEPLIPVSILFMILVFHIMKVYRSRKSKTQKKGSSFDILVAKGIIFGYVLVILVTYTQELVNRKSRDSLVKAVSQYYDDQGKLPLRLMDLDARYINEIPIFYKGLEVIEANYQVEENQFYLHINYGDGYTDSYDFKSKKWRTSQEWAGS